MKYRYLDLTYPEEKGYEGEITHQNGKPLTFKMTDRLVHSSTGKRVQRRILLYHFEGMWTCLWVPHTDKYVYGYSFAFKDTTSNQTRFESVMDEGGDDKIFLDLINMMMKELVDYKHLRKTMLSMVTAGTTAQQLKLAELTGVTRQSM